MAKSYYAILGVTPSASPDEIRAAYRRLAKEYHPDHFTGGSELFQQIQEAYAVLGDALKRRTYKQSLQKASRQTETVSRPCVEPEPLIRRPGPVDFGEISPVRSFQSFSPSADEIFDWLWRNFSSLDWPKSGRIQNMTLEVPLTQNQAMRGGNARIMVPVRAVCPLCHGHGSVGYYECHQCAGEGAITGEMPVSISFPAGLMQDHAVIISLERFGIRNLQLTVLFRLIDDRW
ncbi:MAG: J domain-containing protein [Deltaproteobacteria bacterium]|nr:J domain-containing protein [Deltaproteobacteria bacterium]